MIDTKSQRAVLKFADGQNSDLVLETGVCNLTQEEAPARPALRGRTVAADSPGTPTTASALSETRAGQPSSHSACGRDFESRVLANDRADGFDLVQAASNKLEYRPTEYAD